MLMCEIDTYKNRDVMVADVMGDYLSTNTNEHIIMVIL